MSLCNTESMSTCYKLIVQQTCGCHLMYII